jgi:hypothetical protein
MRKKSKYRPKGVRLDAVNWVLAGIKKVGDLPTASVAIKLENRAALDSILRGEGKKEHIWVLIRAFNTAEALIRIREDLGADWSAELKAAQDAIHTMGRRGLKKGKFVFTGPEMTAVKLMMDIHDAQIDNCTVKEMEMASDMVDEEIRMRRCRPIVEMA